MPIIGSMRIKNEARWIGRVIEAQLPVVDQIYILDDHSTDATREICRSYEKVKLFESPFEGLDESRDKQWLLDTIIADVPPSEINHESPWWVLALDGDEVLEPRGATLVKRNAIVKNSLVWSFRILYLWNDEHTWRTDGVYKRFYRPSMFRLINPNFRYQKTPFGNGANFHCSSIPQEYLHHAMYSSARVFHLGYMSREDRLRKFRWYNEVDPNNEAEDGYRHMVIGDLPEFPATMRAKHGGPLKLGVVQ